MSVEILRVTQAQRGRYLRGVVAVAEAERARPDSQMIAHGPAFFRRYYGGGGETCVALLAGEVVGYALLATHEHLHAIWDLRVARLGLDRAKCGCLVQIAVTPKVRKRGIAGQLVERIVELARARGLEHLLASVAPDNSASLRTLTRCGFVPFEQATVYSEQVVRVLLRCSLPRS